MIFDILFKVLFSAILKVNSEHEGQQGEVLASRDGIVRNETFVYLYIYHQGNINLSLKSIYGDADLYISDSSLLPTYSVESYDLHSATCGNDVINIPEIYGSPISVGVYGHPAYEMSTFVLEVLKQSPNDFASYVTITDDMPETEVRASKLNANEPKNGAKVKIKKKSEKVSSNLSGFFSLLEIFQLIFL